MRPIQGPPHQSFGISATDAAGKDPLKVQNSSSKEHVLPSEAPKSYSSQVSEAKLQGNLRAAELNSAYQHNQTDLEFLRSNNPNSQNQIEPSKIEYPNIVFVKDQPKIENPDDK